MRAKISCGQPRFKAGCVGADFAREQILLIAQQIIVVIIKTHWQAIDYKDEKCHAAGINLDCWDEVAHERLEKCLIRDPGGFEKPFQIPAPTYKNEDFFNCTAPQTPPLAANLHVEIFGNGP